MAPMTLWGRIADFVGGLATGSSAQAFLERVSGWIGTVSGRETRRQIAFTIAMIALSAKMAKADGVVTADEITAFKELFEIPEGQQRNIARMFNLAKQDVAGYDAYARRLARLLAEEPETLEDIVDGLFHIAKADGVVHEAELAYLESVAGIFGLKAPCFDKIKTRHVADDNDPYVVLGAERHWDFDALRSHYRRLVAENHPDRLVARGVPPEFVRIANDKLAAINAAWDQIEMARAS